MAKPVFDRSDMPTSGVVHFVHRDGTVQVDSLLGRHVLGWCPFERFQGAIEEMLDWSAQTQS